MLDYGLGRGRMVVFICGFKNGEVVEKKR